jgi:hypothetical protein
MIFVAIIPSFIWIALLFGTWTTLTYKAFRDLGIRHPAMMVLLAVMAIHALAGSSAAIGTSLYQIGRFPCLMGYYGMWVSVGVVAIETAMLTFLSRLWPRGEGGGKLRFGSWVSIWLAFNVIALLTFTRSSALCTV